MLLDSNIIITYLNSLDSDILDQIEKIISQEEIYISRITCIEVLSCSLLTDKEIDKILPFLEDGFIISELTPEIAYFSAALRRKQKMTLGDAIISASAKILNKKLLTADKDLYRMSKKLNIDAELFSL